MATISRPMSTSAEAVPARRNRWLIWLSVITLIVGVGTGLVVGRVTKADVVLPPNLAGTTVTKMLDDYAKAVNAGDTAKIASLFATDATFTDTTKSDGYVLEGNTKIASAVASWHELGFWVTEGGTAIVNGSFVAKQGNSAVGSAIAVYQIVNGKFQNVWVVRP